jgi:hypothetical protein
MADIFQIGDTTIAKLHELDLNGFEGTQLLPGLTTEAIDAHPEWLDSRIYDASSGRVFLSVHTWVLQHKGRAILIDTGVGNNKKRPTLKVLNNLHNPYLERLASLGGTARSGELCSFDTHSRGSCWLEYTLGRQSMGAYIPECNRHLLGSGVALRYGPK